MRIGNSSRNTRVCGILKLETEIITEKHSHICKAPIKVTEIERQEEKEVLHATCDYGRTGEEAVMWSLMMWKRFRVF